MDRPPPGYYSRFLPAFAAGMKLARTDCPITGMTFRRDLAERLAAHFDNVDDAHAAYYANGLRTGALVPLEYPQSNRTWAPGELFLKS